MAPSRCPLLLAALLAVFLSVALPTRPAGAEALPAQQVETVVTALLDTMKRADELGFQGRYDRLQPVLEQAFDFNYMAQVSVGRHWQGLDEQQRQALIEAFGDMSVATFASRFSGYSGESFQVGEPRPGPRGTSLVPNRIVKTGGEGVAFNFLLRETESGDWRIIDVLLDAKFSELATKRAEYTSVIDRDGVEGLIEILERKTAELASAG